MKNDFIDKVMDELEADGVDFLPPQACLLYRVPFPSVTVSYTKEEWATVTIYPTEKRLYWKRLEDGTRYYI